MILKALYDYYQRCKDLPPGGMEFKEISFLIVLDRDGNFLRFEDRRIDKKRAQTFLVAKSETRSSAPVANLLWDNLGYVLGLGEKKEKQHAAFIAMINRVAGRFPDSGEMKALKHFYDTLDEDVWGRIKADPLYDTVEREKAKNVSFLISGDTEIVASKRELLSRDEVEKDTEDTICLITGRKGEAVKVASATPIAGGKSSGKLVAFQVNSGYDSYGKSQCGNAPISKEAEFCFSSALLRLLAKDSKNKFVIGDRTFVFWASSDSEASITAEKAFRQSFGRSYDDDDDDDDPNDRVDHVTDMFKSIFSGRLTSGMNDRFHVLGLAPNAARISVVYWIDAPLKEFAANLLRHLEDMEIEDNRAAKKPYAGFYRILAAVTLNGKTSDVLPSLPEAVIKSIFHGAPYPVALLKNCLERIHADTGDKDRSPVTITRAAIIKAYLTRNSNNNHHKPTTMLNRENKNPGYLCGRLTAVLEKIQKDADGGASLRTRYLTSASTTPGTVFPAMLGLSIIHEDKLPNDGRRIFFNKLKSEICDALDGDFPARLDLKDQGAFWLGYYQQLADFYKSKETKENNA